MKSPVEWRVSIILAPSERGLSAEPTGGVLRAVWPCRSTPPGRKRPPPSRRGDVHCANLTNDQCQFPIGNRQQWDWQHFRTGNIDCRKGVARPSAILAPSEMGLSAEPTGGVLRAVWPCRSTPPGRKRPPPLSEGGYFQTSQPAWQKADYGLRHPIGQTMTPSALRR